MGAGEPDRQGAQQEASTAAQVVALIPAYQAAHLLTPVVAEAAKHLPVVVVDDGSTDDTSGAAAAAGATVVRQEPNQGKGAALRRGLQWALERGHDAVLTLDADGQHDPTEIPKFLDAYAQRGADLIIGARDFGAMPPVRRLANTLGRAAFSWGMRVPIRDNQSGYRLISRRLAAAVLESDEAGFEFEVEMIMTCLARGYALDWVPIRTIYGDEGSHIRPLHHVVHFLRMVREARRRTRPT
jgi:glycosyltransferase involved in cell wall biosynthesis